MGEKGREKEPICERKKKKKRRKKKKRKERERERVKEKEREGDLRSDNEGDREMEEGADFPHNFVNSLCVRSIRHIILT